MEVTAHLAAAWAFVNVRTRGRGRRVARVACMSCVKNRVLRFIHEITSLDSPHDAFSELYTRVSWNFRLKLEAVLYGVYVRLFTRSLYETKTDDVA